MNVYHILALICFLCAPSMSSASIFFQVTKREGSFMSGTFYYDLLDWGTDDMTPNPCYQKSRCQLLLTSSHNAAALDYYSDGIWKAAQNPWLSGSATIGELGKNFKQHVGVPRSGAVKYDNVLGGSGCVGFFYTTALIGSGSFPARLPSSVCAIPPEEQNACSIVMPQINLDHGVLDEEQVNNNKVSSQLAITCTKATDLLLYISEGDGGVQLSRDGSLYSNLLLNEQPAKKGIVVQAGPSGTLVQVSSVLRKVGDITPGPFQGSAVAILALP